MKKNIGNLEVVIVAEGADEALEKLDHIYKKMAEIQEMIQELSQMKVRIKMMDDSEFEQVCV